MQEKKRSNIRPSKVGMRQFTMRERLMASASLGAAVAAANIALREETAFMDSGITVQDA